MAVMGIWIGRDLEEGGKKPKSGLVKDVTQAGQFF